MTREEAINVLNDYDINFERNTAEEVAEAHEMAIKALETQPSENEKIIRISKGTLKARTGKYVIYDVEWLKTHFNTTEAKIYGQPQPGERTETHTCDCISREAGGRQMNELTKIEDRILARIEIYIADMEKEKKLTNDKRRMLEIVQLIIASEFLRTTNEQLHTEHIIKTTIKEYLDKDCDDVTELLLSLNKDLCERIRKEN